MIITIPNNNINEKKYIIDILFGEFLGLDYKIKVGSNNYEILLDNGNKLIFKDVFFNQFPVDLDYLKIENIPNNIEYVINKFLEEKTPILFGDNSLNITNKSIECGMDIFASSFFMLTRWEEHVNQSKDQHKRFPASESLAYKYNFLERPIVNEYIEMIKKMLLSLGFQASFKQREYQLILTHDIDHIYMWDSFKKFLFTLLKDLIKRPSFKNFYQNIYYYIQVLFKLKKDPYDTYEYIMELSESINVKSHFFFMGKGVTQYDNHYNSGSKAVKKIVEHIVQKGHYVGIHPTYNAYNSTEQFRKEKQELEQNFDTDIQFGREHYLRFEVPETWQVWEDNNMKWDSTINYADNDGFRSGTCYEYSIYNILSQKKLNLKEKPLIVMDANSIDMLQPDEMEKNILMLIGQVEKYKGEFVLLWHNSSFNTVKWKKYKKVYENIIHYHRKALK